MKEWFIVANSFAAPFFSDTSDAFVAGETPADALTDFAAKYSHPCGLYSACAYSSADAYHKNQAAAARWLSNREIRRQELTASLSSYSFRGIDETHFEIDGVPFEVERPREGRIVESEAA